MSGIMAMRQRSSNLTRCDLCHKPSHLMYNVSLGESQYHFCSGAHANQAATNYAKNKDTIISVTPPEEENYEDGQETE